MNIKDRWPSLTRRLREGTDPLTDRQVQWLMVGGVMLVALTVIVFEQYNGWDATLDYLSYVCPCLAAIVAGGAFYMGDRTKDKFYFFLSLLFLVGGLVAYALSHRNGRAFLLVSIICAGSMCWAGLVISAIRRWAASDGYDRGIRIALVLVLAFEVFSVAATAYRKKMLDRAPELPACSVRVCCSPAKDQGDKQGHDRRPENEPHHPLGNPV